MDAYAPSKIRPRCVKCGGPISERAAADENTLGLLCSYCRTAAYERLYDAIMRVDNLPLVEGGQGRDVPGVRGSGEILFLILCPAVAIILFLIIWYLAVGVGL